MKGISMKMKKFIICIFLTFVLSLLYIKPSNYNLLFDVTPYTEKQFNKETDVVSYSCLSDAQKALSCWAITNDEKFYKVSVQLDKKERQNENTIYTLQLDESLVKPKGEFLSLKFINEKISPDVLMKERNNAIDKCRLIFGRFFVDFNKQLENHEPVCFLKIITNGESAQKLQLVSWFPKFNNSYAPLHFEGNFFCVDKIFSSTDEYVEHCKKINSVYYEKVNIILISDGLWRQMSGQSSTVSDNVLNENHDQLKKGKSSGSSFMKNGVYALGALALVCGIYQVNKKLFSPLVPSKKKSL